MRSTKIINSLIENNKKDFSGYKRKFKEDTKVWDIPVKFSVTIKEDLDEEVAKKANKLFTDLKVYDFSVDKKGDVIFSDKNNALLFEIDAKELEGVKESRKSNEYFSCSINTQGLPLGKS